MSTLNVCQSSGQALEIVFALILRQTRFGLSLLVRYIHYTDPTNAHAIRPKQRWVVNPVLTLKNEGIVLVLLPLHLIDIWQVVSRDSAAAVWWALGQRWARVAGGRWLIRLWDDYMRCVYPYTTLYHMYT